MNELKAIINWSLAKSTWNNKIKKKRIMEKYFRIFKMVYIHCGPRYLGDAAEYDNSPSAYI